MFFFFLKGSGLFSPPPKQRAQIVNLCFEPMGFSLVFLLPLVFSHGLAGAQNDYLFTPRAPWRAFFSFVFRGKKKPPSYRPTWPPFPVFPCFFGWRPANVQHPLVINTPHRRRPGFLSATSGEGVSFFLCLGRG